ncbi:MAG TPA: hypothetical protein VND65_06735 [Candidatus Binatia bacterium]|nr:hypothetical protein [Candidatus Binatia bacterium]
MRIYNAASEETLRARGLLKDWRADGFISAEQYERLEKEAASDLRTTNVFLRLVLFIFTLISIGAAVGLLSITVLSGASQQTSGIFLLIFAVVCYAASEFAVSRFRLYRHGIEEALTVCAVGFLCAGMQAAFFGGVIYSHTSAARFVVPAAGAAFSLWIWRRFGLWYALPAAMIFVIFVPDYWSVPHAAQRVIIAMLYAAGLVCVATARSRHRGEYLENVYSLAEAFLWLGIYLAFNLQLSSLSWAMRGWGGGRVLPEFGSAFYWTTWVLIWCLPVIVLAGGIRQKNRAVIGAGLIMAVLTSISNKPYLGWPRHTWDPMLLGLLLAGVAIFVRRWLDSGPGQERHGFTAERLSAKDKDLLKAGSGVLGLLTPNSITPAPQASRTGVTFAGGSSGGGGASSEF